MYVYFLLNTSEPFNYSSIDYKSLMSVMTPLQKMIMIIFCIHFKLFVDPKS